VLDEGPSGRSERQRASSLIHLGQWARNDYVPTQRPATVALRTSLFEDATAIVEREYASELSLDDIARRIASSRRQLQRAYAEVGNTTFREHLTGVRMDRAAELLARRSVTVREVAHRVGYRQPAQFAKAFRRHLGVAPSDYRTNGSRHRADVSMQRLAA
jgi:AraC family transcriptional regulator, regulatory protein of adaptative response / methylphosphotriester-DNA alkyltransferase methyltransferase